MNESVWSVGISARSESVFYLSHLYNFQPRIIDELPVSDNFNIMGVSSHLSQQILPELVWHPSNQEGCIPISVHSLVD